MLVMLFVSSRSRRLSSRFGTKISGGAGDCRVWWLKEESTVKGTRGGVGRVSGGAKGSGRKKKREGSLWRGSEFTVGVLVLVPVPVRGNGGR